MKYVLILLLILIGRFADAQEANTDKLVQQLQTLKKAVLAGDKQTVARYFTFPVQDKNLQRKLAPDGKGEAPIKKVTRNEFVKYYNRLFTPDVVEMFRQLDVGKLKQQAELIVEVQPKSKKEKCSHIYELVYLNNQVMLSYLTNTRTDIQLADDDYCEEYAEFWQFKWENGQLQFLSLEMAG